MEKHTWYFELASDIVGVQYELSSLDIEDDCAQLHRCGWSFSPSTLAGWWLGLMAAVVGY